MGCMEDGSDWIKTDGRHGIPQRSLKSYSHLTVTALWLGVVPWTFSTPKKPVHRKTLNSAACTMMRPIL